MITEKILQYIIQIPPFLFALTLHEFAHGYVAYRLGDPTAKSQGRLSLNPIHHLDPLGTIAFFLIHFGWAKPVPVNASYFRDPRKGMLWVALAGPMTNLLLAIASAIIAKIILLLSPENPAYYNIGILTPLFYMVVSSVWINILLCVLNFIPIPPLDGSRILMGILPLEQARMLEGIERYGFIIVLILMFTGILSKVVNTISMVLLQLLM